VFNMAYILALDPGSDKFGWAVLSREKEVLDKGVARSDDLTDIFTDIMESFYVEIIVLGDRTSSSTFEEKLIPYSRKNNCSIIKVDEHFSTLEGRRRYFEENPPWGLKRLIPQTLLNPSEPFDDYVAVILGERYLNRNS